MNFQPFKTNVCDYTIIQDLQYKDSHNMTPRIDGKDDILSKNKLDLFLPKNPSCDTPVVVFIHGGGWMRGDRRAYRHYFSCYDTNLLVALALAYYEAYWNVGKTFARGGVACAVVSYRLSRLEFPWLIVELCFSFLMSLSVVLTPVICVAVLTYYCSSKMFGLTLTSAEFANTQYMYMSAFPVFVLLILLSFFILWIIICYTGEGYFITPFAKFWPLLISLLATSISLLIIDIEITSITACFTLCLGLCLLHSFATFQQTWRPVVMHPAHITDVALSVKWIRDYGSKYQQFDPDKIFLCGHSAGGHLVSLLALDPTYLANVGLSVSNIKGVMSLSGVYDLHSLSGGLLEYLFLRPAFGNNRDDWTHASPYHQLMQQKECKTHPNSPCCSDDLSKCSHAKGRTPFLIMNAEKDPLLQQDAEKFVTLLMVKEHPCQYHVVNNTNHLSIVLSFEKMKYENQSAGKHCLDFIMKIESEINS